MNEQTCQLIEYIPPFDVTIIDARKVENASVVDNSPFATYRLVNGIGKVSTSVSASIIISSNRLASIYAIIQ